MKGLYKKISAIVLAGMVVLGGGALGGIQKADAAGFLVNINKLEDSKRDHEFVKLMCDFYEIQIIFDNKDGRKVDKFVEGAFKNRPRIKERLSKSEKEFRSEEKNEFGKYLEDIRKLGRKGANRYHRVKFADREYVLFLR